jgi:dienelactone hydrolase
MKAGSTSSVALRLTAVLFALGCWGSVCAQNKGETVWIPMQEKGTSTPKEIKLEATLYKPTGDGPFPVVVFSHGSTGPGAIPATQTENPIGFGWYLNQKGIALLIPMRRGRGKSEGNYTEPYECSLQQSRYGIAYASESLDATFNFMRSQPWADMSKVVLAGQSRGGMLSVVYAAQKPSIVTGVINFVGGWMGDGCTKRAGIDINTTLFREAGAKSRAPNLFLYALGDSYYFDASLEKYPAEFNAAGGDVESKLFTVDPGANGHTLFYRFFKLWIPDVDAFLQRVGVWTPTANK